MTQGFFTARELAEIATNRGITAFPQSERGVRIFAERAGWNSLPSNICRKRVGTTGGGGREYHQSLLSDMMLAALAGRDEKVHRATALQQRQTSDARKLPGRIFHAQGSAWA